MNLPIEGDSPNRGDAPGGDTRLPKSFGDLHKTITMAQIAKAAGVSQGAISSLLNDRDYGIRVSEKTRERVFKVCREMGYIPNDLRAVVRMYPEFGSFSLLLSAKIQGGLANPMAARIAAAAMSALPEASCPLTLALYEAERDYLVDGEALPQPVRSGVCSKFLCYGSPNGTLFQALHRRGFPAISLGYEVALPGVLSLVPEYAAASRIAIRHLHDLGHRQLAIVSGPFGATDAHVLELNRGVRLACDELELPVETLRIIYGDLSEKAGRSALEELFTKKVEPTAIFCMSDAAAAGVLAAAQLRGLKVPEQLSVIGCGDDPRALYSCPQLSTVHLPAEEIAAAGVKEIEQLVRASVPGTAKKSVFAVRLVARESTGPISRS